MAEHRLGPEVAAVIRRTTLKRTLILGVLLLGGGFCYSYFVLKAGAVTASLTCGIVLGTVVFGYFRSVKQQQALAANYQLFVTATTVTRIQHPLPTIGLMASDIAAITQNHAGVLTIATADKYRAIYVPIYVTNRDELLRELTHFAPLTVVSEKTLVEKLAPFAGLLMLGLLGIFYLVSNKIASIISGTLVLAVLAWSGWHVWRNANLPPSARRMRWFFPLVFLSVLASIIARLRH